MEDTRLTRCAHRFRILFLLISTYSIPGGLRCRFCPISKPLLETSYSYSYASFHRPMGSCCSKPTAATREVTQSPPNIPLGMGAPGSSSRRSGTRPGFPIMPQVGGVSGVSSHGRPTRDVKSAPQRVKNLKFGENEPLPSEKRSRTKASVTPSGEGRVQLTDK